MATEQRLFAARRFSEPESPDTLQGVLGRTVDSIMHRTVHSLVLSLAVLLTACGAEDGQQIQSTSESDEASEAAPGIYPEGPFGIDIGDTMADLTFVTHEGESLSFDTIRQGPRQDFMLIFVSAGWCSRCGIHMPTLIETADTYGPLGLFTAVSIYESRSYGPPSGRDAENFRRAYSLELPVFADRDAALTRYFETIEMPMVLVVDLRTMTLLYKQTVWDADEVGQLLDEVL